ncbi:MAG: cold shock domain-containing protein [Prosthecochloris sp.]|nr:cold shock domain-containing protein [Prosthecochloris sp.]
MRGEVTRYNEFRGYGFIKGDDDRNYFVHRSFIEGEGYKYLREGDRVEFDPREVPKGFEAGHVKVIKSKNFNGLVLKPNPFMPQQPMTDPNRFAGREESVLNAVDCLFNHKNLLITGERGIGKSSLAFQLAFLAEGEVVLLDRLKVDTGGYKFAYLTADHRCIPGHDLFNIIESLLVSTVQKLGIELDYDKITTEIGVDVKLLKAIQKTETTNTRSTELVTYFVDAIAKIWDRAGADFNGLCFLVDEIDCLTEEINLAAFLKATIESLNFKSYPNISFVLAGVTGVMTDLLTQHKSFSRLFENIELRRMTESELADIVGKALVDSGVTIESEVKTRIINLSDRFPEPIHLLGYHSFRYDDDKNIGVADFERAINFIIRELKRQEFDNLYGISKDGLGHTILYNISNNSKSVFTVAELADEIGESERKVAGFIGDLVSKEVVVRSKGNTFRLKDPLFRLYLRWVIGKDKLA